MFRNISAFSAIFIALFFFAVPSISLAAGERCVTINSALSLGSSGGEVTALQRFFTTEFYEYNQSYVTGYFGSITEAALKEWQKEQNIVSSGSPATTGWGVTGPRTRAALACLSAQIPSTPSQPVSTGNVSLTRTLSYGSNGADVLALQQFLIQQGFLTADSATGFFGHLTEAAVGKWQAQNGIVSSGTPATTGYGVVGPKTRAFLAIAMEGNGSTGSTSSTPSTPITSTPSTPTTPTIPAPDFSSGVSETGFPDTTTTSGAGSGGAGSGGGGTGTGSTGTSASCSFNGVSVASGAATQAYREVSVPAGSLCISEQRTCTNGTLSGSYQFSSCTVQAAPALLSCSLNGATVQSGASVTAYQAQSVSAGSSCTSQQRTCTNGTLSGSYQFSSCTVQVAQTPLSCSWNGAAVQSGVAVTAYQSSSVSAGSSCVSQQRTCTNGTLSGSYQFSSCTVQAPLSCSWNGATVQSGASVTAYQSSSVPAGSSCTSQVRTCNNGVLSGTFSASSCTPLAPLPHATVSITATPSSVLYNGTTTIAYTSTNAISGSCELTGAGFYGWGSSTNLQGSVQSGGLKQNTVYVYACEGQDGQIVQTSTTVNVAAEVQIPDISYAKYKTRAATEPGDGNSANFKGQIGMYEWGGYLDSTWNNGQPLYTTSQLVANSGFQALRIGISGATPNQYGSPSFGSPSKLVDFLSISEIRNTLLQASFPVVAITLYDFTSNYHVSDWNFLKDPANQEAIFKEYYDFYLALYQLPASSLKTFVILNWEVDNQIYPNEWCPSFWTSGHNPQWFADCNAKFLEGLGETQSSAVDAVTTFFLIRKAALLAARDHKPATPNVEVKYGIEINQVGLIDPALGKSGISYIVPQVKPDIVTDSFYQSSVRPSPAAEFSQLRTMLNGYGLSNTKIGIGEFGQGGTLEVKRGFLKSGLTEMSTQFPELAFGFIWNAVNATVLSLTDTSAYAFGFWQPNANLFVAPTTGLLVPILSAVSDVDASCFSPAKGCSKSIPGNYPQYTLGSPTAQLKCNGSLQEAPFVLKSLQSSVTFLIPTTARGKSCQIRVRSDLGIPSEWSNSFSVQ